MDFCSLASGSRGNLIYVGTESTKLLIDVGITCKSTEDKLAQIGVSPTELTGILITHEHSDHINGLKVFANKYDIPVYAHNLIWNELHNKTGGFKTEHDFFNSDFYINDITISPFKVEHDSVYCVGFSLYNQQKKISVVTDLGIITKDILQKISQSDIIFLEANHDINMLINNPNYSAQLKRRILSSQGHLSNKTSAQAIVELANTNVRQFVLAHLSEQNNTPEISYNCVANALRANGIEEGKDVFVDVATQHKVGAFFVVKNS
ncbi:MAG: MBL fold metallo-hydrolase [Clostridia bacterium]|jgi:phosphoribosyl 1,2-cyclic phosphodiesterase|nr:MBL fold metallo-hydrolase [Clostridia bacterium]MDD4276023.1 MBL fold metallo-hydrolase [Clostridia bacterium]